VSQTKAAPRLREAIRFYLAQHDEELDEYARKLLTRLASSDEAAGAFERLKPKDDSEAAGWEAAIIRVCTEAENLARTFPQRLKKLEERLPWKQEERLARRKRFRNAVTMLRRLLNEISWEQKHPDPLLVRGPETDEDIKAMGLGLALFERRLFFEEDLVGRNLFWLKVTRKREGPSKTLSAGQIAAMKWFVDKVERVTGKAHEEETRSLLKMILGTEVSPDQVRAARRANEHWQWMALSPPEEMRKPSKEARSRRSDPTRR
jgi:hypothetical protein